jgi:hypothetical protein
MNCYECAKRESTTPAVSVCRTCGAGLCLEHTREAAMHLVGGTHFDCPHDTLRPPATPHVDDAAVSART